MYNSSTKMAIDSSGNVGIGTTSPADKLEIGTTTTGGNLRLVSSLYGSNGLARFYGTDGNEKLQLGALSASAAFIFTPASTDLVMYIGNAERMRILSGGDVCIGKTTNDIDTQGFHVIGAGTYSGSVYSGITGSTAGSTYHVRDTTNNAWKFYVTHAGVIHATSTSITSLSDERLKENIVDLETGLNEVMSLQPRRFDWKKGQGSGAKNVAGFIAQEVETVLPDLIDNFMHDDLEDAKSVKMGDMIPTLVKAIQEQQAQIEALQSEINLLKGE